ncbi:MAG: hypothetical protein ABIT38_15930 [Gemmatimonadaceae bacterium]
MTRALLSHAVDYAGLFPPAALSMSEAVANYAMYSAGNDAWALGRFVAPIARLQELEAAAETVARGATHWHVSALADGDLASDAHRVTAFNRAPDSHMTIDVVEGRATSTEEIAALHDAFPNLELYVEIAPNELLPQMLDALRARGLRAKIRTGGVVAEAIPDSRNVARFIAECVRRGVPFKATAGLHHPVRGDYPLTYAPDSPRGTMFGFVNVFAATAAAIAGSDESVLASILEADAREQSLVEGGALRLGEARLPATAISRARREAVVSFGSCSFREPVDELFALAAVR